jgi:hypothetical protein
VDDARKEKEFEAGFDEDFDRLGEEAVSRHLSSGNFSAGKAEMARIWLDRKRREAAQAQARANKRAETRANIAIAISVIALLATLTVPFVTRYIRVEAARQDDQIVFSPKAFHNSETIPALRGQIPPFVNISGTLTGDGVGYPNNTNNITCRKDSGICLVSSVEQIGLNQVGSLGSPTSYDIKKWGRDEIIATGGDPCNDITITILLRSEVVAWVQEPIRQSSALCANPSTKTYKWTIENSPGWRRLFMGGR